MTDLADQERLSPDATAAEPAVPEPAAEQAAPTAAAAAPVQSYRLQFTGNGGEYFRIWVVNLLLTIVTLGIYSAWAKVRKARYFWQNTRLDGHVFDYHGAPLAILRGRIVAVLLLGAYTWTFQISRIAGLVTLGVLCAIGPWLFWKAQQFKLRNTSHRGLRFDFRGGMKDAYISLLPLLLIWTSGTFTGALLANEGWVTAVVGLISLVLFPWMHHRLKSYQHGRACYGDQQARFSGATGQFYLTYAKGILVLIGAFLLASLTGGLVGAAVFYAAAKNPQYMRQAAWIVGLIVGGTLYTGLWPYFAARLQRIVWDRTQLGALRFRTTMTAGRLFGIVAKSVLWTVCTFGFYWPYAAIRLARYRVESMEVLTEQPLDQIAMGVRPGTAGAAGDGAVEMFGLDVGL